MAALNGIGFTDEFVIRIQQHDNADFRFSGDEDGFRLDNINIYETNIEYSRSLKNDFKSKTEALSEVIYIQAIHFENLCHCDGSHRHLKCKLQLADRYER